jgi:serine/threonine protein kinase
LQNKQEIHGHHGGIFARKIIRLGPRDEIPHEARIVDELQLKAAPENMIRVFRHGLLNLIGADLYYIDMEFCDFDLHSYIANDDCAIPSTPWGAGIYRDEKRGPADILNITKQIATGLEFLHGKQMVHRDMKPRNSRLPLSNY